MTQTNQNTDSVMTEQDQQPKYSQQDWIASRGVRAVVYLLDTLILMLLLSPLIFIFDDILAKLGFWLVFIGILIQVLYFGIQNSHIRQGQTFAKKWLNICVLDTNNQYLSVGKSCLRSLILALPFALNGATLPFEFPLYLYIMSGIVFGGMFSIIYLLLFNKGTKQNLHDLLIGSYVVNINAKPEARLTKSINKIHKIVVAIIFALTTLALPLFVDKTVASNPENAVQFEQMELIQTAVVDIPEVMDAGVSYNHLNFSNLSEEDSAVEKSYILTVQVKVTDESLVDDEDFAQKLASMAKNQTRLDPSAFPQGIDEIDIVTNYGYNFVVFSKSYTGSYRFNYNDLSVIQ